MSASPNVCLIVSAALSASQPVCQSVDSQVCPGAGAYLSVCPGGAADVCV